MVSKNTQSTCPSMRGATTMRRMKLVVFPHSFFPCDTTSRWQKEKNFSTQVVMWHMSSDIQFLNPVSIDLKKLSHMTFIGFLTVEETDPIQTVVSICQFLCVETTLYLLYLNRRCIEIHVIQVESTRPKEWRGICEVVILRVYVTEVGTLNGVYIRDTTICMICVIEWVFRFEMWGELHTVVVELTTVRLCNFVTELLKMKKKEIVLEDNL